ncbi:MAG: EAL domain-containing protein [Gemmatimonadota bacterium]
MLESAGSSTVPRECFLAAESTQRSRDFLSAITTEFRDLLDAAPDALVVLDASGLVIALNAEAEHFFGWTEQQLFGEEMGRFIPDRFQRLLGADRREEGGWPPVSLAGESVNCFARRRDGSEFPVELSRRPLGQGPEARSLVMVRDLTQWRRAQESRSRNNEGAHSALEAIGDAVITTDESGSITYLNPVAERLTGWTGSEAIGQSLDAVLPLISEISRLPVPNTAVRCFAEGRAVELEEGLLLLRRDGTEVPVGDSAAPINDRNGVMTGVVMVIQDESEKRRVGHRLSYEASHDLLTGLLNRREFERRLTHTLAGLAQMDGEHALLCLDLDRFKAVNDSCGHDAGDALLRSLGPLLNGQLRKHDTLARIGGDEFGVLLENCEMAEAERIAESIRREFDNYHFEWAGNRFTIGVSIGMVPVTAGSGGIAGVLRLADAACYAAKEGGGNRIHRQPVLAEQASRLVGMDRQVTRLMRAIEEGQFELYGQSIVPLQPALKLARRYEILLRLPDGHGRMQKAADFLPQAERYRLMPAIDLWVIRRAIGLLREWRRQHTRSPLPVFSINLSASALADDSLIPTIVEELTRHDVAPGSLCFEVGERAALVNLSRTVRFFTNMRTTGCGMALEDFGTGVTSLTYLRTLPVDFLKIGGSFVNEVAGDPMYRSIVHAVTQIGRSVGIPTIAKQVGNENAVRVLQTLGVDYAQGRAFVPPVPLTDEAGNLVLPEMLVPEADGRLTIAGRTHRA